MNQLLLGFVLIGTGAVLSLLLSNNANSGAAFAQFAPPVQSGDALWHLPVLGDAGWFLHASNGMVRACNMDKASVVGERTGPMCSNWK